MTVPAAAPPRDAHGRVLKGHSLNPGGRPKGELERVRESLRPHEPLFAAALAELAKSQNESTRLAAIREFYDRLCGKPVAVSETDATVTTLDARVMYMRAVQAASAPYAAEHAAPVIDLTATVDEPAAEIATNQADDAW